MASIEKQIQRAREEVEENSMATDPSIIRSFKQLKQAIRGEDAARIQDLEGQLEASRAGRVEAEKARNALRTERDQARAARDTWAALKDGMERERDIAQKARDYWKQTHGEQERYFEGGIKDDAQRAGIDAGGTVGMATVHMMAEEIQKCHQVRSTYWSSVQEAIHAMEKGVKYALMAQKLREAQRAAGAAYGAPPPPDQAAELQVRCDMLETGIRDALQGLQPGHARGTLTKALEDTGLAPSYPVGTCCCSHGCGACD